MCGLLRNDLKETGSLSFQDNGWYGNENLLSEDILYLLVLLFLCSALFRWKYNNANVQADFLIFSTSFLFPALAFSLILPPLHFLHENHGFVLSYDDDAYVWKSIM